MSLVARQLEANGIATVVIGSAKDIMEFCGAPRFVFTDFPLGNPCGRPGDITSQQEIMGNALKLLASAEAPGESLNSDLRWDSHGSWKSNYMYVGPENAEALKLAGEQRMKERKLRKRTGR